jgi:myo-inositol-1(or 4)-monophosphatase
VAGRSGRLWVIDPIDGTFNFVRGGDQWAISIGLYQNFEATFGVVNAPVRQQMLVGGHTIAASLNGRPLARARPLDRQRGCIGLGLHPAEPAAERLAVLDFVMAERMMFRCCGSSTISLLELALGHTDGYIGLGEASWDVMASLPILSAIGIGNTVDWRSVTLQQKLRYAAGTPSFLGMLKPELLHAA